MPRKRYTRLEAARLLGRFVDVCNGSEDVPYRVVLALFAKLLRARLGNVAASGGTLHDLAELREGRARELLRWARTRLSVIAQKQKWLGAGIQEELPRLQFGLEALGPEVVMKVGGNVESVIAFQIFALAAEAGVRQLFECDCGKSFVQAGKRRYCSAKCQRRVYMRRFRNGEAGKDA